MLIIDRAMRTNIYTINGVAARKIAKEFIKLKIGEKVPTITELATLFNLPRGTAQNALMSLQNIGAIKLNIKGGKGSFLLEKDVDFLLKICGINNLAGVISLPYTKESYDLAYSIYTILEKNNKIITNIIYIEDDPTTIKLIKEGRFDFGVISKSAYENYAGDKKDLSITSINNLDNSMLIVSCDEIISGILKEVFES